MKQISKPDAQGRRFIEPTRLEMRAVRISPADALRLVLDQVDYQAGNCQVNQQVGAVLSAEVIRIARESL